MSDQVFCYHCRRHHPADQVTQVCVRGVKRWRCRQSLALSRSSAAARDAFGRTERPLPHPVLELFNAAGGAA